MRRLYQTVFPGDSEYQAPPPRFNRPRRRHGAKSNGSEDSDYRPPKIGALLLELRDSLERAAQCRLSLEERGFPRERWLEVVKDVDPHLRFMGRRQILDVLVDHLHSEGVAIPRRRLAHQVALQGAATLARVQYAITVNLRNGNLSRFPNNRIGLAAWKKEGCE
jgi:hypothetical protein